MSGDKQTLDEALADVRAALRDAGDKYLLPIVKWMDRQLRRWPWLYGKLGG